MHDTGSAGYTQKRARIMCMRRLQAPRGMARILQATQSGTSSPNRMYFCSRCASNVVCVGLTMRSTPLPLTRQVARSSVRPLRMHEMRTIGRHKAHTACSSLGVARGP